MLPVNEKRRSDYLRILELRRVARCRLEEQDRLWSNALVDKILEVDLIDGLCEFPWKNKAVVPRYWGRWSIDRVQEDITKRAWIYAVPGEGKHVSKAIVSQWR